jgi:cysteine desulfurase
MIAPAGFPPVYLDHHATTPVDPRVAQVVLRAMTDDFGNPNSAQHSFGQAAAALIVDAARKVALLLGAEPEDVRFTSSASEALRLALAYAQDRAEAPRLRIAVSRIEHPALLEALAAGERGGRFCLRWIEPDGGGRVSLSAVQTATEVGVDLVCLMAANNETGVLQPVREAAALAHKAGAMILVDATQAAGRTPISQQVDDFDFLVVSAHKMYGPKGVGALVGRGLGEAASPSGIDFHDATPNVPGIAGFGEAARLRRLEMAQDERRIGGLRDRLQTLLTQGLPGLLVNGDVGHRLAGSLHVSAPDAPNDVVVANLRDFVALSTGAACVSGVDAPSHVLQAMGLEPWRQDTALRMGLGRFTTAEEVDRAAHALIAAVQRVQSEFRPAA